MDASTLSAIDVHAHIFNGSDLQVSRFLSQAAAPGFAPVLQPVIRLLAPLLQVAAWLLAPTGKEELDYLKRFDGVPAAASNATQLRAAITSEARADGERRFREGMATQLQSPLGQQFWEAYRGYIQRVTPKESIAESRLAGLRRFTLDDVRQPDGLQALLSMEKSTLSVAQVFNFAKNFFNYRFVNANYLLENYGCANGSVGVFVALMVDYDYGLGAGSSPPPTHLDTQIAVMERIATLYQGRILPFVAFDPWRYVYEGDSALVRVQKAIARGGCTGVKLYPPMGFAPYGNSGETNPGWPQDFSHFGDLLDGAMDALFSWAQKKENDVPILAHANPSDGAQPSFLNLGSPTNWAKALSKYPSLRICFGHFGNECLLETSCSGASGWAIDFLDLFKKPNAYADWSYFEDVLDPADRAALVERARRLYEVGGTNAQQRIMYGSDWLMLAIEPDSESYFRDFEVLQAALNAPGLRDRFFVLNAARYLGLGPNSAPGRRLRWFLKQQGMQPSWLDAPQLQANYDPMSNTA
jgi:predicted TIM-barrel fold metal-dependent hydrolase